MKIVSSLPNEQGVQLWLVHLKSQYCDGDGDTVPVDGRFFVLATTYDEALKKADPDVKKLTSSRQLKNQEHQIDCYPVPLETFLVCRDAKSDGRLGWRSSNDFTEVALTTDEDRKRYKLAVCLVPIVEA